jgi:hypothetical protein
MQIGAIQVRTASSGVDSQENKLGLKTVFVTVSLLLRACSVSSHTSTVDFQKSYLSTRLASQSHSRALVTEHNNGT